MHRIRPKPDLASLAMATFIIISIPYFLAAAGIEIYPTLYRVTYYEIPFPPLVSDQRSADLIMLSAATLANVFLLKGKNRLIPLTVGFAIAVISYGTTLTVPILILNILLSFVVAANLATRIIQRRRTEYFFGHFLRYFLYGLIMISVLALARWILYMVLPGKIFSDPSWFFAYLETNVFYAVGRLSPFIMLLIASSFVIHLIRNALPRIELKWKLVTGGGRLENTFSRIMQVDRRLFFVIILAVSITIPLYPYHPNVNPTGELVGTDMPVYIRWLSDMEGKDAGLVLEQLFIQINGGDRPFSLAILLGAGSLGVDFLIRYIFVILNPILGLTTYFMVKTWTRNHDLSLISFLFSVVTFQIIVGMYGGFIANLMAIIVVNVFIMLVGKFIQTKNRTSYSLALVASITILFLHVYTWSFLIVSFGIFVSLSIWHERGISSITGLLLVLIATNIATDFIRAEMLLSTTGLEQDLRIAESAVGYREFELRWNNLFKAFVDFQGGFFTNFLLLLLALIWAFTVRLENAFERIIVSPLYGALLPIILGNFDLQTRVLFMIPLSLSAALGLYKIYNLSIIRSNLIHTTLVVFVIIHLLIYSVRSAANYYFVSPIG